MDGKFWLRIGVLSCLMASGPVVGQTVAGHSSNVQLLGSPPPAVGAERLTNSNSIYLFLEKTLTLDQDLKPDTGAVIPAGSKIRSYFLHYEPPGSEHEYQVKGYIQFNAVHRRDGLEESRSSRLQFLADPDPGSGSGSIDRLSFES